MSDSNHIVKINNVTHSFDRWGYQVAAIQDLSLAVAAGEWLTLIGSNGSGKSTILHLLAGRLEVQSGSIQIAGIDVTRLNGRELSSLVFLVRQDPLAGTAPTLSVYEHLVAADDSFGRLTRKELRNRYLRELERLNLDVGLDQLVHDLSGGQRQLLTVLLGRFRATPIILLDEPFAALDPRRAKLCRDVVEELHRAGKTIILVTHDRRLVQELGHRTVELQAGQVIFDGCIRSNESGAFSANRGSF